ncbi:MAG: glycoside hydrolase family 32 protein [Anaerolineae bacterium]|nr:glycoside hydrolase family 32 protein [Anaerolineae bacterium]MCO5193470.1 glycoside hydrolase family 32 protein [Anaerolineae bacterium]
MTYSTNVPLHIQNDPTRPRYHFCAPFGWMNDPNGTIFHAGYYHVFYQWNPHDDDWGSIHWGHARSTNLIDWEHLPVALKPDRSLGEEHCFSGCLMLRKGQPPMILYTAIGPQMDVYDGAQQWAALGDENLLSWRKHPANPILTAQLHGAVEIVDWRDPFVFEHNGQTFLLLGGALSEKERKAAVVLLYEALDDTLERWSYRGVLFQHPDPSRISVECANFFKLGDRWVLLLATHDLVEYFTGEFDVITGIFTSHRSGNVDDSDHYYATNVLFDDQQRCICFGWIRGFAGGRGWNGCFSLPRMLTVDDEGCLHQAVVPEIAMLHGEGIQATNISLGRYRPEGFHSDALDIHARITGDSGASFGLRLVPTEAGSKSICLSFTGDKVTLNDKSAHFESEDGRPVDVRLFLDRSVVEVFVDARVCLTLVIPAPAAAYQFELFCEVGSARLQRLEAWKIAQHDAQKANRL